jgi:hypothetical protein
MLVIPALKKLKQEDQKQQKNEQTTKHCHKNQMSECFENWEVTTFFYPPFFFCLCSVLLTPFKELQADRFLRNSCKS